MEFPAYKVSTSCETGTKPKESNETRGERKHHCHQPDQSDCMKGIAMGWVWTEQKKKEKLSESNNCDFSRTMFPHIMNGHGVCFGRAKVSQKHFGFFQPVKRFYLNDTKW